MTVADAKTVLGVLVYIGCGMAGDLILSHAMRQMEPVTGFHLAGLLRFLRYIVTTPAVVAGTTLMGVGFGTFLAMLSWADLSVVVPSGAGSYLFVTLLSRWVLREAIPPQRWLGVFLVTAGVALVLSSSHVRNPSAAGPDAAGVAAARAQPEARASRQLAGRSPG